MWKHFFPNSHRVVFLPLEEEVKERLAQVQVPHWFRSQRSLELTPDKVSLRVNVRSSQTDLWSEMVNNDDHLMWSEGIWLDYTRWIWCLLWTIFSPGRSVVVKVLWPPDRSGEKVMANSHQIDLVWWKYFGHQTDLVWRWLLIVTRSIWCGESI